MQEPDSEMLEVDHIPQELRRFATSLSTLKQWKNNPRRGDVEAVKRSLERFGQQLPVLYRMERGQKVVYAGNHRVQAAIDLGWEMIAARELDGLSAKEARAFALADNRTAELATWDEEALIALFEQIDSDDLLAHAGWSEHEIDRLLRPLDEPPLDGTPSLGPLGHSIVIDCDDEQHQRSMIDFLTEHEIAHRAVML